MTIYLMVYEAEGTHYSTRFLKPGGANFLLGKGGGKEVFTVQGSDLEKLDADAREEARKRGIANVVNLDS